MTTRGHDWSHISLDRSRTKWQDHDSCLADATDELEQGPMFSLAMCDDVQSWERSCERALAGALEKGLTMAETCCSGCSGCAVWQQGANRGSQTPPWRTSTRRSYVNSTVSNTCSWLHKTTNQWQKASTKDRNASTNDRCAAEHVVLTCTGEATKPRINLLLRRLFVLRDDTVSNTLQMGLGMPNGKPRRIRDDTVSNTCSWHNTKVAAAGTAVANERLRLGMLQRDDTVLHERWQAGQMAAVASGCWATCCTCGGKWLRWLLLRSAPRSERSSTW